MKQIKHIFILVTIVLLSVYDAAHLKAGYEIVSSGSLLEQVITEVQNPKHKEEKLLSLLLTLLEHGKHTNQSPLYAQSVFKLFSNIIKGAHYINAYTLSNTLEQLVLQLEPYFGNRIDLKSNLMSNVSDFDQFKATVYNTLYVKFSTEYESFKRSPESFLDTLSQDIFIISKQKTDIDTLRATMIRFLELTLGKLIWSPENQEGTWDSVKTIAKNLTLLFDNNILEDLNDLDDLYWSLIHRYCFFLDITGSMMRVSFYQHVKNDIATNQLLLLTLAEQDDFIEPKSRFLHKALVQAEVKARALEKGIIL